MAHIERNRRQYLWVAALGAIGTIFLLIPDLKNKLSIWPFPDSQNQTTVTIKTPVKTVPQVAVVNDTTPENNDLKKTKPKDETVKKAEKVLVEKDPIDIEEFDDLEEGGDEVVVVDGRKEFVPGQEKKIELPKPPSKSKSQFKTVSKEELSAEDLKQKYNQLSDFLEKEFRNFIRKKYRGVSERVILPIKWVARPQNKFAIEGQFRGIKSGGRKKVDGIYFQFIYTPEAWVLVDTNYQNELRAQSLKVSQKWAQWGNAEDWTALFAKKEKEPKLAHLFKDKQKPKTVNYLPPSQVYSLMRKIRGGDPSVAFILAQQLDNPRTTLRAEILKSLRGTNSLNALLAIKEFSSKPATSKKVARLAIQAIGASDRKEAYPMLRDFLDGQNIEKAMEASRYLGKFKDTKVIPELQKWANRVEVNQQVPFIQAIGDIGGGKALKPLEALFWNHHGKKRTQARAQILRSIAMSLYSIKPDKALVIYRKALLSATEREQVYFLNRFYEVGYTQAIEEVRKVVARDAYSDLNDYIDMKTAAINFIGKYGNPEDVKLLNRILKKTQGYHFASQFRQAAERAKQNLSKE